MIPPRKTPDRDSRYMGLALMISAFSKDKDTQVGAIITSSDNRPLGSGYNGAPKNIDDNSFSWERPGKRDFIEHAEVNAIDYSNGDLKGSTLYCTSFPCKSCMLRIVKKEISRVVYLDRQYDSGSMQADPEAFARSMEIATLGGVQVDKFEGSVSWLPEWIENLKTMGLLHI
jgi:dCMP deaminase